MKVTRRKFLEWFGKGIPAVLVAKKLRPEPVKPEPEPEPDPVQTFSTIWDGSFTSGCYFNVLPRPVPTTRQTRFDI